MLTSVGRLLRKLRIDNGEILKTMADRLGVSSAFLSAVENGKKKMPESWYTKLETLYSFSDEEKSALQQAVAESSDTVELLIKNTSSTNRNLAISFARQFDSIDDETSKKIIAILNKKRREE